MRPTSVVLIGMPGAGKSTVGVLLSKRLGLGFLDTDLVIQQREGRLLQTLLEQEGHLALRDAEERAILSCRIDDVVVATGGSAVYSTAAMEHLKRSGVVVALELPLDVVLRRIGRSGPRGIARAPGQSFEDLYAERQALYRRWADVSVNADTASPEDVCDSLVREIGSILAP